ncbi:MAG: M17 family peptidase N-terminal domain-containing protein, partial [Rickettsiella sp.]|nr:M17 family peptidase N-terminal domain-containing protein [Rickettsiella sp.]
MNYIVKSTVPAKEKADCLIVGVFKGKKLSQAAKELDEASQGTLTQIIEKGDLAEELGKTLLLYSIPGICATRVLFAYCGEESNFKFADFRKVLYSVGNTIKSMELNKIVNYLTDVEVIHSLDFNHKIRQGIEITEDCFYKFNQFKTIKIDKVLDSDAIEFVFN